MKDSLSIKKGKDFVHSRIRGPLTKGVLAELISKTSNKAEEWRFNKFLVDFREAQKQLATFDDYNVAYEMAKELGFKLGSRHAIVVYPANIGEFGFVETVFRNAGYNLKIFSNEQDALKWLEK